jgi:hypothetical protein
MAAADYDDVVTIHRRESRKMFAGFAAIDPRSLASGI